MRPWLRYNVERLFIILRDYGTLLEVLSLVLFVCFCFYFWWRAVAWNSFYKFVFDRILAVKSIVIWSTVFHELSKLPREKLLVTKFSFGRRCKHFFGEEMELMSNGFSLAWSRRNKLLVGLTWRGSGVVVALEPRVNRFFFFIDGLL